MALVLKDRVKETTQTSGTGTLALLGASQGFQAFSVVGEGNITYYTITDGINWEVGVGTYSVNSLSRDTVISSSQSGGKVNWGAGTRDVFCTLPANSASMAQGINNLATGQNSIALGGDNNTATSDYAAIVGGRYGKTRGIVGYYVTPASNAPLNVAVGNCQTGRLVLGGTTIDATPTRLCSDALAASVTNQMTVNDESIISVKIRCVGRDATDWRARAIGGVLRRDIGAASTVLTSFGESGQASSVGANSWVISIGPDTTLGCLGVTVTGAAGRTIKWVAVVDTLEVVNV